MKPNVLLVVLDTLRANNCSVFEYERPTTPGLESLADESVVYEHAIAPETWTVPSHAAMLTGQYPSAIGVHAQNKVLPDGVRTVSEQLHSEGYATAMMSSNPFLTEGTELYRGCEYRYTAGMRRILFEDAFDPAKYIKTRDHERGLTKAVELAEELAAPPVQFVKNVANAAHYKYRTRVKRDTERAKHDPSRDDGAAETIDEFTRWFDAQDGPAFACLNFMEAHTPLRYRDEYLPDWADTNDLDRVSQDRDDYLTGTVSFDDDTRELLEALYDGEIRYLDEQLQRLWSHLRGADAWDDTLLIVTSDHGEYLGENDLVFHGVNRLGELQGHVPLLVKYPDQDRAGTRVTETVSLTQIPETILGVVDETHSTTEPLEPDQSPDLVKTEFVCMDTQQSIEDYTERFRDLDVPTRAVYDGETKYLLFEDGRAFETEIGADPTHVDHGSADPLESVPENIVEFANFDVDLDGSDDLDVSDSVEARLEDLGYR